MALFSRLRAGWQAWKQVRTMMVQADQVRSGYGSQWASMFGAGLEHLAVSDRPLDPMAQVGVVYSAESKISQSLGSVPWGMFRGETRVPEHALPALLERPNESLRGSQILEATCAYLDLHGRAFWLLNGIAGAGRDRFPRQIDLLHPDRMKADVRGGKLVGWKYQPPDAGPMTLSAEEVVRIAYFDHRDPFGGLSRLSAARQAINLNWRSSRFQDLFYEKGGMPPFYIHFPADSGGGNVTEAQLKNAREQFRQEHMRGLATAWTVPGLARGGELKSISVNQKDAEWMATQDLTRTDILSIFDISPGIAGYTAESNYSISASENRTFWGRSIKGRAEFIRSVLQADLVDRFWPGDVVTFDWSAKFAEVMPEETRAAIASMGTLWGMGVPADEAGRLVGVAVDTTSAPWLKEGWLPFSVMRASAAMTDEPEPEPEDDAPPEEADPEDKAARRTHAAWPKGEKLRAALWKGYGTKLDTLERRYLGDWRGFLNWLRDETVARLRSRRGAAYPAIDRLLLRTDESVPPLSEVETEAVARTDGARKSATKAGWDAAMAEVGAGIDFDLLDPRVLALLSKRKQAVVGASKRVLEKLRGEVAEGIASGETIDALADRVRSVMAEEYRGQARTVARTETASSFSGARNESFKAAGITKHEWLSARDSVVRESHIAEDGNSVVMGEEFPATGLRFPLDPDGPAEEVVNCRCVALPVVEE